MSMPQLSIVIPVRDEEENLAPLLQEIGAALERLELPHEVIFVDDGSSDGTWKVIAELHREAPAAVRGLRFRENCGKAAALAAGFAECRADTIITMDGDGQDDPAEIPRFLAALEGADLVSGWKRRRHDPWHKVIPSRLFNRVVAATTGVRLHDVNCGFKAYRRPVTEHLPLRGGLYRFIPVFAHHQGYRVTEIEVAHRPRVHGRSKYGWRRLLQGARDLRTVLQLITPGAPLPEGSDPAEIVERLG